MKRQFIFLINNNDSFLANLFSELERSNDVFTIKNRAVNNKFVSVIRKIHLHPKTNNIVELPFKRYWLWQLNKFPWNTCIVYYVICTATIYRETIVDILSLQKKYDIRPILFMIDPWDSIHSTNIRKYFPLIKFRYIFSFDQMDAQKHNFIYSLIPYSVFPQYGHGEIKYDLCYIGANRGRVDYMQEIYRHLKAMSIVACYRITHVNKKDQKYKNEIIYNEQISYSEVIDVVEASNCILEVIAGDQSGATMRYYEAICYNKKLLTNNKNVSNLPFYNSEYIHIFDNPEDIDWEWVRERTNVDYHYDGSFSPLRLVDRIIELEELADEYEHIKK